MRPKYYKLAFKKMKFKRGLLIFLILFVLIILTMYFLAKRLEPVISTLCDSKVNSIALTLTNGSINDYIKDVKYEHLVDIKTNDAGKIIAINANVMEMNKIATLISSNIQNKISNIDSTYINVPVGSILNLGIFSGIGPKIAVTIVPVGFVSTKFESTFEEAGINQTRHRIFLVVATKMRVIAPFYSNTVEYKNEVVVAEMILLGDTPASYYNINGLNSNSPSIVK